MLHTEASGKPCIPNNYHENDISPHTAASSKEHILQRDHEKDAPILVFHTTMHTYKVLSYPAWLEQHQHKECILWMRTVARHLKKMTVSPKERMKLFSFKFGSARKQMMIFNKRYPAESSLSSQLRVKVNITSKKCIPSATADQRARKRVIRTAKHIRNDQSKVFRATAALIRYGLLKSGGKYQELMKLNRKMSSGKSTYGISLAQYPSNKAVTELANAIYQHPELLTNSPEWVIKYRKGRLKLVNGQLVLPTQQLTVSQIPVTADDTEDTVTKRICTCLKKAGLDPSAIKVRKGKNSHDTVTAAAYVYFESAYQTRCAVQPLKPIGRVSLGQTIVTSRVVASKVRDVIDTLISEADGFLAQDFSPEQFQRLKGSVNILLDLQEWIDKDGRVTFIKVKIVDPTHTVFKHGESRVHYLLEYVGNEAECRRFYPALVDQFAICNDITFQLHNGMPVRVNLTLTSGDHLAAWAKSGRSGGHEHRDLFSDHSLASYYHLVAYQDQPKFSYSRHVDTFKKVQIEMRKWDQVQIEAKIMPTATRRTTALMGLYRIHGRVERIPALTNGEHVERPSVYRKLLMTPLVLHNQSYCNLITLELGLDCVVKTDSKQLRKLQGRLKGLVDGIGTTKCATSGSGIRHLINDCLCLEEDTAQDALKYAPIWYLMDTMCYHLHLKGRTKSGTLLALMNHERLAFASCTFTWWALMGDLSDRKGGRKLKTGPKNHLENKIYAYEMVSTCPEWEERTQIPLSLIDESLFEASFSPRDEMINCVRSKVNIEAERKIQTFRDILRTLVPKKTYRSIMARLPRHIRRNIIIRSCWKTEPKWSFNLRFGFLRRCARYSYSDRIFFSLQQAIFLNITGPPDPFHPTDQSVKDIIIDPCGTCGGTVQDSFNIPLKIWWAARRFYTAFVQLKIRKTHTSRLRACHLIRARRHLREIRRQCRRRQKERDPVIFKNAYDGYSIFQLKYPGYLQPVNPTTVMLDLLKEAEKRTTIVDIWDGDTEDLPSDLHDIVFDTSWTVKRLKAIIRYFKLHGLSHKQLTRLKGNRQELCARVIELLETHRSIAHLPDA